MLYIIVIVGRCFVTFQTHTLAVNKEYSQQSQQSNCSLDENHFEHAIFFEDLTVQYCVMLYGIIP